VVFLSVGMTVGVVVVAIRPDLDVQMRFGVCGERPLR
jgi:hypothetical protein